MPEGRKPIGWFTRGRAGGAFGAGLKLALGRLDQLEVEWLLGREKLEELEEERERDEKLEEERELPEERKELEWEEEECEEWDPELCPLGGIRKHLLLRSRS